MKSRSFLGTISGIDRARVMDLQNPEPERPLAAHFRATCLNDGESGFHADCLKAGFKKKQF